MSDLISRQDIKYHTQLEAMGNGQYEEVEVAYKNDIESLPSADAVQIPIKLEKRYPQSRDEDITDAFMRGYLAGRSSADRPTGEWISEELENMICNEICYYKEVTADAESLNDLCEGCLIKKRNMADRQEVESATINNEGITFSYRKTGEWIKEDDYGDLFVCSECGFANDYKDNYCSNCGAKMGGDSDG